MCWSLFLIGFQAFEPATLLKRNTTTVVSIQFCESFKNTYSKERLQTADSKEHVIRVTDSD